jgi:hypothetical protein
VITAYSFPLLSLCLMLLVGAGLFIFVWAVIWAFIDDFRRPDHSGWAKAGWAFLILCVPVIGLLLYIAFRPAYAPA